MMDECFWRDTPGDAGRALEMAARRNEHLALTDPLGGKSLLWLAREMRLHVCARAVRESWEGGW